MSEFAERWNGRFESLLSWEAFDAFFRDFQQTIDGGWYIFTPGEAIPVVSLAKDDALTKIKEIVNHIRTEHQQHYCGIVYVDNPTAPAFIKIYDPHNLGEYCASGADKPLPLYILTTITPEMLPEFQPSTPKINRLRRLFGG
jgi:hypothetical protein